MRGIKVGNILIFRKNAVCIISSVIKDGKKTSIVGIDCNNFSYEGTPDNWGTILHKQAELRKFEDVVFNNIISSRQAPPLLP